MSEYIDYEDKNVLDKLKEAIDGIPATYTKDQLQHADNAIAAWVELGKESLDVMTELLEACKVAKKTLDSIVEANGFFGRVVELAAVNILNDAIKKAEGGTE